MAVTERLTPGLAYAPGAASQPRTRPGCRCPRSDHPQPNATAAPADRPRSVCWCSPRVAQRQRVRERQRAVPLGIEGLERRHIDRLGGDAHPPVAAPHELVTHQCRADVEVIEVRRVQHLNHDVAAEPPRIRGAAHEDPSRVRRVPRAHDGRTSRRPVIRVRFAADEVLVCDIPAPPQVLGNQLVVSRPERVRVGRYGKRANDRGIGVLAPAGAATAHPIATARPSTYTHRLTLESPAGCGDARS